MLFRSRQNTSPANNASNKYVGAPYNFVPFYDKVYQYPDHKLTSHNSVEENLITGEITYKITAETPIMIDDGTYHFFTDAKGRYAIPGSTMRGLIRNNVQVLGLCSYEDDIDESRVTSICIKADEIEIEADSGIFIANSFDKNDIGKTVFLTKEEAQKALQGGV